MTAQVLSYLFTFLGLVGFWLAGKKVWWCWYVNIANQILWMTFALITGYYALIIGSVFYFVVFCKNAVQWTKDHFADPEPAGHDINHPPVDFKVEFDSSQFQQVAQEVQNHLPEITFPTTMKMVKKKGQPLELNGNPIFISSTPSRLNHICHASEPPHDHAVMCPTGEHAGGWQHVPGPHKMCDICR